MRSSSIYSLLFAAALNTVTHVSAQAIWLEFAPVSTILNATDDFLLPITIGSNSQTVYLNPSLTESETFLIGPQACTPKGESSPRKNCTIYRGGVYTGPDSTTYSAESTDFSFENGQYSIFAKGSHAKDNVKGQDGEFELDGYGFGLVQSSNMTSGMLGLSKNSTFLQRLVDEKKIGSRSFGLHVGIDIWNHPFPVLNPSFDESGLPPKNNGDFDSGAGKRSIQSPEQALDKRDVPDDKPPVLPVRASHKFPGSLTLGGYDKSKISNKTKPISIPIAEDGTLRLTLTNLIVRNTWYNSPFDLVDKNYDVVIDADTPLMWFPDTFARSLGNYMGASYGDPGIDFFHDYDPKDQEGYLGNITMTFKSPDGKGDDIDILVPPTVFFQPIGYMKNFELQGDPRYNYYAPLKEYRGEELPIRLGRS